MGQNYSHYEHIVIDGDSQDNTVEILKQYPHVKWISEPDEGEAQALNKALKMVKGDIVAWLNADDYYLAGVFDTVVKTMNAFPDPQVVFGDVDYINDDGKVVVRQKSASQMGLPVVI